MRSATDGAQAVSPKRSPGDLMAAVLIAVGGVAASLVMWNMLPHPGRSGKLVLDLVILFATLWVLSARWKQRRWVSKAATLFAILLFTQGLLQGLVWFGIASLD